MNHSQRLTALALSAAAALSAFASDREPVSEREPITILFEPLPSIHSPEAHYAGFSPGETVLPKGYVYEPGRMPLATDTIYDRDVAIKLRDGTVIYADVYRPVTNDKVPAIISYGPAGKRGALNNMLDNMGGDGTVPLRMGVPRSATSGMQAWESPDPAHWVPFGYAIVNVDVRGSYMSQGDLQYFGPQNAQDGYDVVEFLARQGWCNGKIGMGGNSWYAITQWLIAAERPPHLAAIAPWEGENDIYRDEYVHDGIPIKKYPYARTFSNGGRVEDIFAMIDRYPLMNSYWESKIPDLASVEVPAYVVASYNSQIHVLGTFKAFHEISSKEKWLRVHNTHEWPDLYDEKSRADLRRFYDHYLKGMQNDWTDTPRVRLSVLDPGGVDIVGRPEADFPIPRQRPTKLFLDAASAALSRHQFTKETSVDYDAEAGTGMAAFTISFDRDTEITGFSKLRLWVEAKGAEDMDVFTRIVKQSERGEILSQDSIAFKYSGPDGRLRVSQRQLDPVKSSPLEPFHTHRVVEPLKPGEIVPIEIQLWPTGMIFHKGQKLQLVVASFDYMPSRPSDRPVAVIHNKGRHVIHTGGRYDSYLLLPFIPPK